MPLIGAPVRRVEDARFLTGQGRYVADLTLPRMLHVAFGLRPQSLTVKNHDADAASCPIVKDREPRPACTDADTTRWN